MATFAMICNNRIIEVLYDLEVAPIWPPDQLDNPVTSVECSAEATRDWVYNPETGEVSEPIPVEPEEPSEPEEPITPEPTQMDRIEEMLNNLTSGTISADGIAEAIAEGVNEV